MKILGLILELNPFHNGHKYFIDKVKEDIKPDIVIAIISTSFTMRGDISVLDKHTKTKLCLENGIDIVLENPFVYTNNSSDYYAYNSIKILNAFNITHLAFGSELGCIPDLNRLKEVTDSDSFNELIKEYLDKGNSYQTSALKALYDLSKDDIISKELVDAYSLPNNTLALSYLKAIDKINKDIIPYTIKRFDNNYFDSEIIKGKLPSATSLRFAIDKGNDISEYIPNYKYEFIKESVAYDKLYMLYSYKMHTINDYDYIGISEGIENRLLSFLESKNYFEYTKNVCTKRYTLNRIQRIILNILFDNKIEYQSNYKRVLGINEKGMFLIKKMKDSEVILNTNKTLKSENINSDIIQILKKELYVSKIYDLITGLNTYKNEFILQVKKDDN